MGHVSYNGPSTIPAGSQVHAVSPAIELRHLSYFVSAVDCGSMSRGALANDVSQPTFSTRILQLESALGVALLHRNGRGVTSTAAGRILYERVKPLITGIDAALIEAAAADAMHQGEVVVGIVPSIAGRLSVPLAGRTEGAPTVPLRVVESFSGHLQAWLAQGEIDIAVCTALPRQRGIRQVLVRAERLQLVGTATAGDTRDHVRFAALDGVPLILGSRVHSIRQILNRLAERRGVALNIAYEIDGLEAQLRFVHQGLGYAILPAGTVDSTAYAGLLRTWNIVEPNAQRQLVIATQARTEQAKPAVRAVAERIAAML